MSRQNEFERWLKNSLQLDNIRLHALAGDASFRRYFRIEQAENFLAVDAPPCSEKTQEFVDIARTFEQQGVHVPHIENFDAKHGFLIVSYLGDTSYLQALQKDAGSADKLYKDAMQGLAKIMHCPVAPPLHLEKFDRQFIRQELNNFTEWFLQKYLKIEITDSIEKLLQDTYQKLIMSAEQQPQVCVHRDYHSRNLIVVDENNPGIIDFQDAVYGPLTYDLVSLLRDAYIDWPLQQVETWVKHFYQEYVADDFDITLEQFHQDFDLMGVQRHLKATFIFARKWLRDKDASYLNDIYRTLNYILDILAKHPEYADFHQFMAQDVAPKFSLEQAS
jgi:hypothetical protein